MALSVCVCECARVYMRACACACVHACVCVHVHVGMYVSFPCQALSDYTRALELTPHRDSAAVLQGRGDTSIDAWHGTLEANIRATASPHGC